jgi:hypothetical protein
MLPDFIGPVPPSLLIRDYFIKLFPSFPICFIILVAKKLVNHILIFYLTGLNLFSLNAFNRTNTELKLIAADAIIGFKSGPPICYQ